ncbi:protein of unknown function [uncultured Woeseiaceae bacterium]|uniref:Tyrosine-protein kinase G-rich domain-containing protein n=1 Tax=uncultured Woeseiaceae bacterium TaxID=1983305 RepID=A0A7D9H4N0_9GAMM|nr:protein of unknown function [uncultured Woeseiaceae bacterium]
MPLAVEKGGIYTTGVQKEEVNSYINLLMSTSLIAETVDAVGVEKFKFEAKRPETLVQAIKYFVKAAVRGVKQLVRETTIMLGLKKELTDRALAIKLVQRSLSVNRERDSNVISMSLRLPDGELARHVDLRRNIDVALVFEAQTETYHDQLVALQLEMAQVRADWRINSVPEQRTAMIARLQGLKAARNLRIRDITRLTSEEVAIREQLELLPDKVVNTEVYEVNPSVIRIRERIVGLEIQRVAVANTYEEESEQVRRIDREIGELRNLLAAQAAEFRGESTYGPHHRREKLLSDLADLRIEIAGLHAAMERDAQFISELNADLLNLSEGEAKLVMMDLDWQVLQQKYLANATRREEASIEEAMNMNRVANIAILSPPMVSAEPVSPNRLLLFAVGIGFGLFIALIFTFLREWGRGVVYEESDVYALDGLYPLGVVSIA